METTAEPGDSRSQECSSCDASSARCWCLDCDEALCDECVSAHRRVSVTRSHRLFLQPPGGQRTIHRREEKPSRPSVPPALKVSHTTGRDHVTPSPGNLSILPIKFCRVHPSEALKLFCFTCSELTCRDCQLMAHKNHRYNFVNEVEAVLKKKLEDCFKPIRGQREAVRRSLQDIEIRLKDINMQKYKLESDLHKYYISITAVLKKQLMDIQKEIEKMFGLEREQIQKRRMKLLQLEQSHMSVTATHEKAQNTTDLATLITSTEQINAQLKDLMDQDSSPPETMPFMVVTTDMASLSALLNFCVLRVSWVPFSVSNTSNENSDTPAGSSSSSSITPPTPTCKPSPCAEATNDTSSPFSAMLKSMSLKLGPCSSSGSSLTVTAPSASASTSTSASNPSDVGTPVMLSQTVLHTSPQEQEHCGLMGNSIPGQYRPVLLGHQGVPVTAARSLNSVGQSPSSPSDQQTLKDKSSTALGSLVSSIEQMLPNSSREDQPRSPKLKEVVHSTCDLEQKERQQEPAENESTTSESEKDKLSEIDSISTEFEEDKSIEFKLVISESEEDNPTGNPSSPSMSDSESETSSSMIGHLDVSLNWQPKVSLLRLPESSDKDVYLEEPLSNDILDDSLDFCEPLSSPESSVTLEILSCSACGAANTSVICSACCRGYHRDCHLPPLGPSMWSVWICSLCQDLSDPSDPYNSERSQSPKSICLSLQNQRRCESLLLFLKVEGCARLSEFGVWPRLKTISERLTLRQYQTATQFICDIWALMEDASSRFHDNALMELQQSFQKKLEETLSSELHPSVLINPSSSTRAAAAKAGGPNTSLNREEEKEESKRSKVRKKVKSMSRLELKETRTRLRTYLNMMGQISRAKKSKMDK